MIIKKFLYFFILSKKILHKPPQKKILIWDSDDSEVILKYFNKREVEILDMRMAYKPGQKLNLYVLILTILKFKFSSKFYFDEYIKIVKPEILVTMSDNYPVFYGFKKNSKKMKKVLIQRACRTLRTTDVLSKLKILKKNKNNHCDYLLMFNMETGKIYQSFLKGKIIPVGSFKSNSFPRKKKVRKIIDLLYISVFRLSDKAEKEELIFLRNLKSYCQKREIKLQILGSSNSLIENDFYSNIFGPTMFKFIPRYEKRKTYSIVDCAKITVSIDSTLGYEAASRGNNVGFFCIRSKKKYPFFSLKFGWPVKKKNSGPFWTNKNSFLEMSRILDYLSYTNTKDLKRTFSKEFSNVMRYDKGNKKFLLLKKNMKHDNS